MEEAASQITPQSGYTVGSMGPNHLQLDTPVSLTPKNISDGAYINVTIDDNSTMRRKIVSANGVHVTVSPAFLFAVGPHYAWSI